MIILTRKGKLIPLVSPLKRTGLFSVGTDPRVGLITVKGLNLEAQFITLSPYRFSSGFNTIRLCGPHRSPGEDNFP